MFGNLISNWQIKQLLKTKDLIIEPFKADDLKSSHYTLHAGRVFTRKADGDLDMARSFRDNKKSPPYELKGDEYVVVEAFERVKFMTEAIVGRFIAPSSLIEGGLALVAGQISNKYGSDGEGIRFGLKNLTKDSFFFDSNFRLAHIELFDLRGIFMDTVSISPEEKKVWLRRALKAIDDGVDYGDGS